MAAFLGRQYKGILGTGSALGQEGIILPTGAAPTPSYTPVLDSMSATPQFAWGVYQLSSSVTSCFECRRSSDNAETTIGFDANGLLDAAAVATHIGGGNGFAADFYDAEGVRDASEASAALQLRYKASGSLSKPCVEVVNGFASTPVYSLASNITMPTTACTIFFLYSPTATRINGTTVNMLPDNAGVTRGYIRESSDTDSTNFVMSQGAGTDTAADYGSFLQSGSTYLVEIRRDTSSNTEYFVNNVSIGTGSFGNRPDIIALLQDISTAQGFFEMYELLVFNTDISAGDKATYIAHINNEYGLSLPSYDPDAEAYFTAAGITDTAEKDAVNQLVLNLKGTGSTPNNTNLWTDAAAFYPISPTSLAASAYNLRDTTSLNMTWANSPTHASTGVTFNGTTQYGDTGFNPSTASLANGYDLTLGVQIVNASVTAIGLMSAFLSTGSRTQMLLNSGNLYQDIHNVNGGRWVTSAGGTYQGRMIVSADRLANGGRTNYLNGTSLGTKLSEDDGTPVNLSLWTGAQNNGSGGQNFTAFELAFGLIIPKGLNATAVADLDYAISTYNATVLVSDPDAAAFISSAGITSRAECEAVNQLVKDLKGTGSTTNNTDVWSDMNAIYPVSPTSLSAAAYNLKDPTSYNITWANSPTHSADGVVGNGLNQYGDTNFNPNTSGSLNSFGVSMAINTNVTSDFVDSGVRNGATSFVQLNSYYQGNVQGVINTNAVGFTSAANANTIGVYTAVRRSATDTELYKDGASVDVKSDNSVSLPTGNVYILARNLVGTGAEIFSTRRMSFYAIHAGLTDNQATDLYDAINTYNTALNR